MSFKNKGFRKGIRTVREGKQYEVKIYWRSAGGIRHSKSQMVYGTYSEARHQWIQMKATQRKGEPDNSASITVNDFLDQYLDISDVRRSTRQSMEKMFGYYVRPWFGDKRLSDIRSQDLEAHYADMRSGSVSRTRRELSAATVAMTHRYVRTALNAAVRHGYLLENPATAVKLRKQRLGAISRPTLTRDQLNVFLDAASKSKWELLFHLLVMSGLRMGEGIGLRWDDIDFDQGLLKVRRSMSKVDGVWVMLPPKGGVSRSLRLPEGLLKRLSRLYEVKKETAKENVDKQPVEWIFPNPSGTSPAGKRNIDRAFKVVLKRAGLPDMRLHDLRHTHATLLNVKHPLKALQERLGHEDIQTTLTYYVHSKPEDDIAIVRDLQASFYDHRDRAGS